MKDHIKWFTCVRYFIEIRRLIFLWMQCWWLFVSELFMAYTKRIIQPYCSNLWYWEKSVIRVWSNVRPWWLRCLSIFLYLIINKRERNDRNDFRKSNEFKERWFLAIYFFLNWKLIWKEKICQTYLIGEGKKKKKRSKKIISSHLFFPTVKKMEK